MITLLAATLALASPLADLGLPGEAWVSGGVGSTFDQHPALRLDASATWLPYPEDAWGGLSRVSVSTSLVTTAAHDGNTGILLWVGYGRVRPGFWITFDAGIGYWMGWQLGKDVSSSYSPGASVRIGYGFLALRFMSFIISGQDSVFHDGYHGATLEGYWKL